MGFWKAFYYVVLSLSFLGSPFALGQDLRCREIYKPVATGPQLPQHPMSAAIEQLLTSRDKVLEFLDVFSPQTQRQFQKLSREIDKVVEAFVREQDLSDPAIQKLMAFNESLARYQSQILERADMLNLEPLRLRRLLFIKEPIDPNFTYFANNLPGFGKVDIHFSKDVADFFNERGANRDIIFPTLFKGRVGAHGSSGLKEMSSIAIRSPDGMDWRLFELKRLHYELRILVMVTEGHLFFIKSIENHNRVEYVNKENIPQQFFQSALYRQWIEG